MARDWVAKDFRATRNASWQEVVRLPVADAEDEWTLQGCSVSLQVRPAPGHDVLLLNASLGNWITLEDVDSRLLKWDVPHTQMELMPAGDWYYDIVVTDASGHARKRVAGRLSLETGVTR